MALQRRCWEGLGCICTAACVFWNRGPAMKAKHKRLIYILIMLSALGGAVALVLNAFSDNLQFFYAPSDILSQPRGTGKVMRLGGMVVPGSIEKSADGLSVTFRVTDFAHETPVRHRGVLPDLFKENSGAVMIGTWDADGVFTAQTVLAKHDEKYMPPEVAKSLKPQPFKTVP